MAKRKTKRIGFLAFDQMQALDLFGPLESFQEANDYFGGTPRYETLVITGNGRSVVSSSGVKMMAHTAIVDCPPLHTLIIAGGAGARRSDFPEHTVQWVRSRASKVRRIGSICTGLFILARTGLLAGMRTTTHWQYVDEARKRFPGLRIDGDALFYRHGKFFTVAGVTSGIDMALALIEEDHGPSAAADVARRLVVFFKRPGDQRQFSSMLQQQRAAADEFADLVAWIPEHLAADLSSAALAERVGLSERQFRRRFSDVFDVTPAKYIESIRIEQASHWLSTSSLTIERVARDTGFRSADTLRRAFERLRGVTPSDYRSRFGVVVQ